MTGLKTIVIDRKALDNMDICYGNLRAEMYLAGYKTISDFAEGLGWCYSTLWSKMAGNRPFLLTEAREIALHLKQSTDFLFFGDDKNDNHKRP